MAKYSVEPFNGPTYEANVRKRNYSHPAGSSPCVICAKLIDNTKVKHWAIVIDGGAAWGDENSDENDSGYMGAFPVGADCHRKYRVKETN